MKYTSFAKSLSRSVLALLAITLVATMAFGQNINNTGGTITNNSGGIIQLTGTFTGIPASIGGTVEFNNAGTQTIPAATYVNLKASGGAGDKTLTTGITVSGVLTANNTGKSLLLSGGTLNLTGATPVTVSAGSVDFTTGTVNYNNDIDQAVYGTTYQNLGTSSTAVHTKNAGGAVTVTGTLTNASPTTLNFGSNTFIGTGATFVNSGTLQSAGTVTVTSTASIGGTFAYNSGGAQTIAPATYNNLDLSAGGGKTFTNGATYNVGGAYTVAGGARTYTGSLFNYTGTSPQTITGEGYAILGFSGSGAKNITAGTASASGAFTQAGGDVTLNGGNLTLSSTGSFATNVIVTSGTLTLSGILRLLEI